MLEVNKSIMNLNELSIVNAPYVHPEPGRFGRVLEFQINTLFEKLKYDIKTN